MSLVQTALNALLIASTNIPNCNLQLRKGNQEKKKQVYSDEKTMTDVFYFFQTVTPSFVKIRPIIFSHA